MIWEVIVIAACSLLPLLWLGPGEVILGNDSGARINGLQHLINLLYSWNPTLSFGYDWTILKGHALTKLPEVLFQTVTGSLHTGQQGMFVFWFMVLGLSMYGAMRLLYPSPKFWVLRLWSSLLWMHNFYILFSWINIDRAKFSIFAALPLLFAVTVSVGQKKLSVLRGAVYSAILLFFLNGGGSPPLFGSILLVVFVLLPFHRSLWGYFLLTGFLAILTNAWWVLPLGYTAVTRYGSLLASYGGTSGILVWEAMVSKQVDYLRLLRLEGMQQIQPGSYVPLILIPLLLLRWRNIPKEFQKNTVLFPLFVLLPVSLLFTAGTSPPFGFIYRFLIEHIPGFAIFRSPFYKFAPALWLPMIILSGISIQVIIQNIRVQSVRVFLAFLVLAAAVMYHMPYIRSNFFAFSPPFTTKVTLPAYVPAMIAKIAATDKDARILLLPPIDNQFLSNSYTWGYWSQAILPSFGVARSIVTNEKNAPPVVSSLYRAFERGDIETIESTVLLTGITHALWQDDVLYADGTVSSDFQSYLSTLLRVQDVTHVASAGAWRLFRFSSVPQHLLIDTSTSVVAFSSANTDVSDISPVLTGQRTHAVSSDIGLPITSNVLEATCADCDSVRFTPSFSLPTPRILPDSPLYFLITSKENRAAVGSRLNRSAMVDLHTGLAGKRLAELSYLSEKNSPLLEDTASRLEDNVEAIADLIQELPPESQIFYANRVWKFLDFYENEFAKLSLPDDLTQTIRKRFYQTKTELLPFHVISDRSFLRYYVNIAQGQTYEVAIYPPIPTFTKSQRYIEKGLQTFEVPKPQGLDEFNPPRMYLVAGNTLPNSPPPPITYTRVSATEIRGTVAQSEEPYLLTFGDAFNSNWTLSMNPSEPTKHITVDGYANGWVVPAGPESTFRIYYRPQTLSIVGMVISIVTLIIVVWYLFLYDQISTVRESHAGGKPRTL